MKLKCTQAITTCVIAMALMMQPFASNAGNTTGEDDNKNETKKTEKTSASRNNSAVRIYPDIVKRVMHVVAKGDNDGQGIDFFIFNTEGTLLHHYKMKAGNHRKLYGLKRGRYTFRVFAGDEETASGNFEMR